MVRFPVPHKTVASKNIPVSRISTKIPNKEKGLSSGSMGPEPHSELKTFEHEIDTCVNSMKGTLLVSWSCGISHRIL